MSSTPTFVKFMPPLATVKQTITVNGRTYSAAPGASVDVPYMDAFALSANNWCEVAGSGTTAQRPTSPFFGQLYHDNSLGLLIVYEGSAWRNPATGSTI
jgi:hypothetical protein